MFRGSLHWSFVSPSPSLLFFGKGAIWQQAADRDIMAHRSNREWFQQKSRRTMAASFGVWRAVASCLLLRRDRHHLRSLASQQKAAEASAASSRILFRRSFAGRDMERGQLTAIQSYRDEHDGQISGKTHRPCAGLSRRYRNGKLRRNGQESWATNWCITHRSLKPPMRRLLSKSSPGESDFMTQKQL